MDISECLQFIERVLQSAQLPEEKKERFCEMHQRIVERNADPVLYLSMLSSFSAGKSTLINALLERKLLKTANEATTAIPTFIRQVDEKNVSVRVKLLDGTMLHLRREEDRQTLEGLLNCTLPRRTESLIELLTTDVLRKQSNTAVHDFICEVHVDVPSKDRIKNLCIIDTPGVNAGANDAAHHVGTTVENLQTVADAAMVLFPAHQAYTHSFEEFLDENAVSLLEDSIFVLSMMDLIEEEEQEEVIDSVVQNLTGHFHLEAPVVLYCSAGRRKTRPEWAAQFETFRETLFNHLKANRTRILRNRIHTLLREILSALNDELEQQNDTLQQELQQLQDAAPPDLDALLSSCIADTRKKLEAHYARLLGKFNELKKSCPQRIENRIQTSMSTITTRSGIEDYAKTKLKNDILTECCVFESTANATTQEMERLKAGAVQTMRENLQTYYGKISNLNVLQNGTTNLSAALVDKIQSMNLSISKAEDFSFNLSIASGVVGLGLAAVVFSALGPLGWLAGGVAAVVAGNRLMVAPMRTRVLNEIVPKLPDVVKSVSKEVRIAVFSVYQTSQNALTGEKDVLMHAYHATYEDIWKTYQSRRTALEKEMKKNHEFTVTIQAHLSEIQTSKGDTQ